MSVSRSSNDLFLHLWQRQQRLTSVTWPRFAQSRTLLTSIFDFHSCKNYVVHWSESMVNSSSICKNGFGTTKTNNRATTGCIQVGCLAAFWVRDWGAWKGRLGASDLPSLLHCHVAHRGDDKPVDPYETPPPKYQCGNTGTVPSDR